MKRSVGTRKNRTVKKASRTSRPRKSSSRVVSARSKTAGRRQPRATKGRSIKSAGKRVVKETRNFTRVVADKTESLWSKIK